MKNCSLFLFVLCILLLAGCREHVSSNAITVIGESGINEVKSLSSIFENPRIIQLETTGESLIGPKINKIKKENDKYYISSDNKTLVTFDRHGNFLHRLQKNGRGPGEYFALADFDVLPNGNLIIMDYNKLLLYSGDGKFIKGIPLDINCYNLKAIDENRFLISASGEDYLIYLIDGNGKIVSKQLKRDGRSVLGISVVFYALGDDLILYQEDFSNDFLGYDIRTGEFKNLNLLRDEKKSILSIESIKRQKIKNSNERNSGLEYVSHNSGVKLIRGLSSYGDCLFFALGNQNAGYTGYLMDTSTYTVENLLTENTVDDISFTNSFSLLGSTSISDSKACFIAYTYGHKILEGLNKNKKSSRNSNYERLDSLLKNTKDIESGNPILIELR